MARGMPELSGMGDLTVLTGEMQNKIPGGEALL
jgi:hypothetical protein